jgi:hypothetical protein
VWDLRYPAPLATTRGYPISAVPQATPPVPEGPPALPGEYRVRLTVEGRSLEAPLTLRQDPRVRLEAGALEAQLRLAKQLAELLDQSSRAVRTAKSLQAQLKERAPGGAAAPAISAYQARLDALLGSSEAKPQEQGQPAQGQAAEPPPRLPDLQERVAGLYPEVTRGDGAPTAAQRDAVAAVQRDLAGPLAAWQQLQADLPPLNQQLRAAHLAVVSPDLPPPREVNVADED